MARRNTQAEEVTETVTPPVNESGSTETITIQGYEFIAPAPYSEGHVLSAAEAGVLNQTYQENLRNNFAGKVKAAKEAAELEPGTEGYAAFDHEGMQALFSEYAAGYQFGVRRPGASSESKDPVISRAMVQARKLIRDKIRERGYKLADYADQVDGMAKNYLDTDAGQRLVAAVRESIAREAAITKDAQLDLSGLVPAAAA